MAVSELQKGFVVRVTIVVALLLAGLVLTMLSDSLIAGMETASDMNMYSWLKMIVGLLLFAATPLAAMITLHYGGRHKEAIRENTNLFRLLTIYRILFWLSIVVIVVAIVIVFWLAMHLGSVR